MKNVPRILNQAVVVFAAAAAIFAVYQTARSASRGSVNYALTVEALTGAGGAAASTSFTLMDSATAESATVGKSASASYSLQMGVVQNWTVGGITPTPTSVPTPTPVPTPPPSTGWLVK